MTIYVAAGNGPAALGAEALGWVDAKVAGATGNGSTDDTTALQDAINSVPTGGTLYLPPGTYKTSSTLTIDSAMSIVGAGVTPLYGSLSAPSNQSLNVPFVSPYLDGCVINMVTPATDVINITTAGLPVHLRDFGIIFDSAIRWLNTGNGIVTAPPAYSATTDNGPFGSRWCNVLVYGHDGNHYAYKVVNPAYCTFEHLHSWGGGGLYFAVASTVSNYGNTIFTHSYHQVIVGGSAYGIYVLGASSSQVQNLLLFLKPQVTVEDLGSAARSALGITTAPTSSQYTLAGSNAHNVTFMQGDFESNVSAVAGLSGFSTWNADKAGLYNNVAGSGGAGWE